MAIQENCVYVSTATKKRVYGLVDSDRVVLGELTISPKKQKKQEEEQVNMDTDSNFNDDDDKCYASSIYTYLRIREMEEKRRPLPDYMDLVQTSITGTMREIVVDWLVEVVEEYKLVSDTLYLTVAYMDRFLSSQALSKNNLQLLAVSCMLVASKYEEISPPHVEDFCYVTDNSYRKEEVLQMESNVLKILTFDMSTPTAKNFVRILTEIDQPSSKSSKLQFEFLASYLAELSLLDCKCLQFLPSTIAASTVFLSKFSIWPEVHPWSLALQQYSGYTPSDLKDCILAIHDLQLNRRANSVHALRNKYMNCKPRGIATLSSPPEIPAHYFEVVSE